MNRFVFYIALLSFSLGFSQDKAQEKQARDIKRLISEAYQQQSKDNFAEAEAKYREAIAKDPKNTTPKYNLGTMYYAKEKNDDALKRFAQAAEIAETKEEKHKAFHNLGNTLMNQKNYAGAVEAYKNALRNNPKDDETRYNFALAKKMLEQNPQDDGGGGDEQNQEDSQDQEEQESEGDNQEGEQGEGDDKEQEGEQEKDGNEGDDEQEGSPEEQQGEGDEGEEQPPKPIEGQLSPQQIQSLLDAMNNEEKKVQDKMNAEKHKGTPTRSEKDW